MKKGAAIVVLVSALGILLSYNLIAISAKIKLQQPSQPEQEEMAPDEFFVSFKENMTDESMQEMRSQGIAIRHNFPKIRTVSIKTSNPRLLSKLQNDPRVEYIEPVPMRYALSLSTEQSIPSLGNGLYGLLTTNAIEAQSHGITGEGINVGIADTGIDYRQIELCCLPITKQKEKIETLASLVEFFQIPTKFVV